MQGAHAETATADIQEAAFGAFAGEVFLAIAQGVDLWRTREKAHFLRDALVRASHANDLVDHNDSNVLNEARALEVYRAAAMQALGENAVGPITIVATYSSQGSGI